MADVRDGLIYKIVNVKGRTVIDLNANDNTSSAYDYLLVVDEPLLKEFYYIVAGYEWHGGDNQKV